MSVPAAYLGVILIWTTTPLAIKWSAEGGNFLFGVTSRMVIGAVLCLLLLLVTRTPLPWQARARRTCLASGLGIFGSMTCVYWGAMYLPSGWISVIFGLNPILTGLFANLWLQEKGLTRPRLAGMSLALLGLAWIFGSGAALGFHAGWGIVAIVLATLIQAASSVWVKRLGAQVPALAVTGGGVGVAAILLLITCLLTGTGWPADLSSRAALSIIYLGVVGSIIGFALYFYVLKRVEATKVALITLVTPVSALLLGNLLNGEPLTFAVMSGTAIILAGLLLFLYGDRWLRQRPSTALASDVESSQENS